MARNNKNAAINRSAMTLAVASCFAAAAHANPTNPLVTNGSASFTTVGNTLTINNSPNTIIRWGSFSNAAGEVIRFDQINAMSRVLNRDVGGNPSTLLGTLSSNGRVYILNRSGILFGGGSIVDVAGLVASSLNLSDGDFLAGRHLFTDGAGAGSVINQGMIQTPAGGQVYLVAPNVQNHGVISSFNGEVILAAGNTVEVFNPGTPSLRVELTASTEEALNVGSIVNAGGQVGIYGALVRNRGVVNATTAVVGANGRVVLKATRDIALEAGSSTQASGGGTIEVEAGGDLSVLDATLTGGNQSIRARSVSVVASGNFASITNDTGDQSIMVAGGNGIDVRAEGAFFADIRNSSASGTQTILATDSDHIEVNGLGFFATLTSAGKQTVSITGSSSANAIRVGSLGALGSSSMSGTNQSVTAGEGGQLGSITIIGPDINNVTSSIGALAGPGSSQTIKTSGALSVIGGKAANHVTTGGNANNGIFNNSDGLQWINAGSVSLQGGSAGANNTALIASTGGPGGGSGLPGNQLIETGLLTIKGGGGALGNIASISAGGNATQTVNAGSIVVEAGPGGTNNTASLQAGLNSGGLLGNQMITAQNISLTGAVGGTNSAAVIVAPRQEIHATGNVTLTAGSSAAAGGTPGVRIGGNGGATQLQLRVDGDLALQGGSAADNGAGIGSIGAGTAFANNIDISARSVTLTGGSALRAGARIGTAPGQTAAAGAISINATGGDVKLNGGVTAAMIRTAGDVNLIAPNIAQTGSSFIEASKLTLNATGNVDLGGANVVSTLSAPVVTTTVSRPGVGGSLTFNNTRALDVTDTVSSGGAMKLDVAGALNVKSDGVRDVFVISSGGQTITAQAIELTAQNNRRAIIENNGGGNQTITATAGGMNLQALGGSGVAQIVNSAPGASQTLSMSGLLRILGGTTGSASVRSGVFQKAGGLQHISASGIVLEASANGGAASPSAAIITSVDGGADQLIDITGSDGIVLTAANGGAGNNATINSGRNQTITGNADIVMAAAAGGNAAITAMNNGLQSISARNITLSSGVGGINGAATILAPRQSIHATGNMTLNAEAGVVTPGSLGGVRIGGNASATSLQLTVDGDLVLNGGVTPGYAAAIGSSGSGPALANDIFIRAASVTLNAGSALNTGARIGTAPGQTPSASDGVVSIIATGDIQLNGGVAVAAIRSAGDVFLEGARIAESGNAFINARNLGLHTTAGDALLEGANLVSSISAADHISIPPEPVAIFPGVAGRLAFRNTGDLDITGSLTTGGLMTLDVAGALNVRTGGDPIAPTSPQVRSAGGQAITAHSLNVTAGSASGMPSFSTILNDGAGAQTITAGSLNVTAGPNGLASIQNSGAGGQTITVTGGAGINVSTQPGGTDARIVNTGSGAQTIRAIDSAQISVNGVSGTAAIASFTGPQTVSITGTGANAIRVGSAGALGVSTIGGPSQRIVAGDVAQPSQLGSIQIVGSDSNNATASIGSLSVAGSSQTISTTGALSIVGGNASNHVTTGAVANNGLFNNGDGLQSIKAASVSLQGGSTGSNNTAIIASTGGVPGSGISPGNQLIETGALTLSGGNGGVNNVASISAGGAAVQTVRAGSVTLQGGSAGTNNSASLQAGLNSGGSLGTQDITAQNITLANGGGTNTVAVIVAPRQIITATGDVTLNAGSAGSTGPLPGVRIGGNGGATNVDLKAANLRLNGGSAANNGAGIGSSGAGTAFANDIRIRADGDVILNAGSAAGTTARIGTGTLQPAAAGAISIQAGGLIELNGAAAPAAIRTAGDVTLSAASLGETGNAFIAASKLTLKATGNADLGGANAVSILSAPPVAAPAGIGGRLTFNNGGDLTIADVVSSGGLMKLTVAGALNVNGNGLQDAVLQSSGGQDITARSINLTAQNNRRSSIENRGGAEQKITATAGGMNLQSLGGSGVAQIINSAPGASQTLSMTGLLNVLGGTNAGSRYSGVFQNVAADQRITSSGIVLQASPTGTNPALPSGAVIDSGAGGNQFIDAGNGDVALIAAAGAGNNAAIAGLGSQAIHAGNISMTNGAGGTNSSAAIIAPHQVITATGDVTLTSQSSSAADGLIPGVRIGGNGGATDLELHAANLTLNGGTAPNNGAGIGSSAIGTAFDNTISITVTGNVALNAGNDPGTGARIGTASVTGQPIAGGNISVSAGGEIRLNGTAAPAAIRTTGDVTLTAASITEGANGFILANALTTTTSGDTSLTGPNQVASFSGTSTAGSITLNNGGPLAIQAINAANAALIRAASVSGSGAISTGTGFTIDVLSSSQLNGVISGTGGLNKNGVGELTLGAVNTYTGDTNVIAGTLALGAADQTTTGNVNIAGGATFRGSPGTYTNAGVIGGNGTLDVAATSFTNIGTLRPGGAGAIGTLAILGDAVLNGTLDIEAQGAGAYDVLAVTGAATLGGALNVSTINGYAPQTGDAIVPLTFTSRSGTLAVSPGAWDSMYNPANLTLVYGQNHWIAGSGSWDVAANWSQGHVPTSFERALIDVPGTQLVTLSQGAQAAERLTSYEDFLLSGGSLALGGPSAFYGALTVRGGTLTGPGDVLAAGTFKWSGGTLSGEGLFTTTGTSLLKPHRSHVHLERTWLNAGTLSVERGSLRGDGTLINEGTVEKNGERKVAIKTGFENRAGGTLNVNDGSLELERSTLNEGAINVADRAQLRLKLTGQQDYVNAATGRIGGAGEIDLGGGQLVNLGTLAPGGSGIGTLTIRGDLRQGATGLLEIDLGGTHSGQYDVLNVDGTARLGGTLLLRTANGYVPHDGDDFRLVTYRSRFGTFEFLLPPTGFTLDADYGRKFAAFELER